MPQKQLAEELFNDAPICANNALTCPHCGLPTDVKDSRPALVYGFTTMRRRRACTSCSSRHTTIEITMVEYERLTMLPSQFAVFKNKLEEVVGHADQLLDRVSRIRDDS